MHQRKSKKVLIYFFLLILFGSINNLNLSIKDFYKIKKIEIYGLDNKNIFLSKIKNLGLRNIFFINTNELKKKIESNNLIESYQVYKRYPSTLNIYIKQAEFLGKINNEGKIFLLGSNGKLLKKELSNKKLPFIFGKPSIDEFLKFKKNFDNSKFSYDQVKNLYFFPSKRWDVQLNNDILLKLPVSNIDVSLEYLFQLLSDDKLNNIKIIDARINNQIIFND
mgnify:CR=1 FL=1